MGYRLGVDVGGTFTDVQMQDTGSGEVTLVKVLSTPEDQSIGVLEGVREACRRVGSSPQNLDLILHGSTVVTNLVLESKGARCGLLTTVGNEQILHLARAWTPGPLYGWMGMIKPSPLAELWNTRGIGGRMAADGTEVEPLDEDAVREAIDALVADGVESVTIGLLNSYVNPDHERRARAIARAAHPDLPISISSDLVSEYREYERALTAVLNAYVQSRVINYVDGLERLLQAEGFGGRLNVVRSDGGTMSTLATKERPVDTAFSGPSGGVVGAAWLARRIGAPNVLTLDVGGTSTDVSICVDGGVTIRRDAQLGYYQFQSRGSTSQRRRRRRLDAYLTRSARCGWAAERGPSPGRPPTVAAATADRDRCQCRAARIRRARSSPDRSRSTRTPRAARSGRSPQDSASTSPRLLRRSSTSPTRTCTRRCGWSASSAGLTRGSLACWHSAGRDRCTPTRSGG